MAWRAVLLCVALVGSVAGGHDWDVETPLDAYVKAPDPYYKYEVLDVLPVEGGTMYVLNMTSQKWMDESFTETPVWWHYLTIIIPDVIQDYAKDAGYIVIGAGSMNDSPPDRSESRVRTLIEFSRETGAVSAYLKMVPNQPIFFTGSELGRVEDFIIGYTWREYIEAEGDPDPFIVLQLPMVKSAKLALDTMRDFVKEQRPDIELTRFMPHGYSKRGWVSWLLGCVDKRIFAMAPTVLDLLNFLPNLEHHYRAYGGWSWAFLPYWLEDVARYLYHPRTRQLASFIDPFEYNERLTMPKLIIIGSGDQFFLPDGSHYFFDDLNGPKFMQLWENDDHSLRNHRPPIENSLRSFFKSAAMGQEFPVMSWTREETENGGSIVMTTASEEDMIEVKAWMADTDLEKTCETSDDGETICRRDFREETSEDYTNTVWSEYEVESLGGGQYKIEFEKRPDLGYRGFFIEMTFNMEHGGTLRLSTEAHIIPDTFPYPVCTTPDECNGRIV